MLIHLQNLLFQFHPSKKYAYILTELSAELVAMEYDNKSGCFSILEYVPTLPSDFTEENTVSAIHISPDGKFLYASNRGHDSIAIFSIDNSTGMLQFVEHTSTEGSAPRDFAITPNGDYLIAANQFSSNLVPFSIDKATGKISRVGDIASLPNPVCIKFLSV
jgi:6-phosphogluconolactonase